jgi:hypothetical protein
MENIKNKIDKMSKIMIYLTHVVDEGKLIEI